MGRHVLINPDAAEGILESFIRQGIEPLCIPKSKHLHRELSGHPDLQFFLHDRVLFTHPDCDPGFIESISEKIEIRQGKTSLRAEYPRDCPYNIACTGRFAFHRTRCSEKSILDYLASMEIPVIDVKQGYSRCSTLIVDGNSIVTSDTIIHRKALEHGLSSLNIRPGHVVLPGFAYGFIGGASGFDRESVYLSGRLDHHPDGKSIEDFIRMRGKRIVSLSEGPLADLGSFLIFQS